LGVAVLDAPFQVTAVTRALKESVPVVKFVFSFLEKLTKVDDPDKLGSLACTIGYQQSIEQAMRALGPTRSKGDTPPIKRDMKQSFDARSCDLADACTATGIVNRGSVYARAAMRSSHRGG
jgi:hypothetical protein